MLVQKICFLAWWPAFSQLTRHQNQCKKLKRKAPAEFTSQQTPLTAAELMAEQEANTEAEGPCSWQTSHCSMGSYLLAAAGMGVHSLSRIRVSSLQLVCIFWPMRQLEQVEGEEQYL